MNKKYPWLPVDERLVPDIISFSYPKSFWVRSALFVEMLFAVLAVVGTLILTLLPKTASIPPSSNAASTERPVVTPYR